MDEYYSRGKLILMGEYAVMHGADAVCLPLGTGQKLAASSSDNQQINWRWIYKDTLLADYSLDADTLQPLSIQQGDTDWSVRLIHLIRQQNPGFLKEGKTLEFANLFPPEWGLGSSSATISSLCRMAGINPYPVNDQLMGGSGADIASTTARGWFLYRKTHPTPISWELPFPYPFGKNTYFIYSGKKQATASHLQDLKASHGDSSFPWLKINSYAYRYLASTTLPELMKIICDHERLIAMAINKEPISDQFTDFPGNMKSLGAWGGDFFMAVSLQDKSFVKDYFLKKGYSTLYDWEEFTEKEAF